LFDKNNSQTLLGLRNEQGFENILEVMGRVERNGVIESIKDNIPIFVHKTFAEFLVADFFWDRLNRFGDKEIFEIALSQILFKQQNQAIIKFLNRFMENSN